MRILFVIDSLGSGGAQRQLVNLSNRLSVLGHRIEIFFYKNGNQFYKKELNLNKIKLHEFSNKKGFSLKTFNYLRVLFKSDYDVVISFLHSPSIYSALAKLFNHKVKLIICERSSSLSSLSLFKKTLFYLAMLVSNKVVCNSYSETIIKTKMYGLSKKVSTIWNGYKISNENINYKKTISKNILVIGRVSYVKNGINLMRALLLFLDRNDWCPVVNWVGRIDNDKIFNEMEEFLFINDRLKNSWLWLGERKDISKLYTKNDALILCSLWEGLPNVICEAMLKGCNTLASDVCDNSKLLQDGLHGYLFNPNSPLEICYAIENFYKMNEKVRIKMSEDAMSFAKSKLDILDVSMSYEKLINETILENK